MRLYPLTQSHSPSLANERLCISLGEGVFGEMVKRIPEIVTIGGRTDVVGTDLTATIALILVGDLIVVFANPLREALHCTRVVIEEFEERRDVCTVGTLELAEAGAQNWTLRPQSRYLGKLDELAAGKRVEADKVRKGLVEAFGFNRDLCDTFLLYLIDGHGYRALRKDQPVANVDYGSLQGLVLERGERLAAHEWANVKEFIQRTWQVPISAAELTVAAQDQLWRQLNATARGARQDLDKARQRLAQALQMAGATPAQAPRLAVLDAAVALNYLATREDVDPCDGLRALLGWKPEQPHVTRERAADQVARRQRTLTALEELQTDTLGRIVTLAGGGNVVAAEALQQIRTFLTAPEEQAELTSHVVSWKKQANGIIDAALKIPQPRLLQPEVTSLGKPAHERLVAWRITSIQAEIGGQTVALDAQAIEPVVGPLLRQVEDRAVGDQSEVTIHIVISQEE